MTPKEKANDLYEKHCYKCFECDFSENAKLSAIITVDEIIKTNPIYPNNVDWDDAGGTHEYYYSAQRIAALNFWNEVLKELKLL
jgi:hypothetical protein